MCGRFTITRPLSDYADYFSVEAVRTEPLPPNYNVAPTQPVYAVAVHRGGRLLGALRWGLVPHWAADLREGARRINARAETLADKPVFRNAFMRRRCLIPADGFYEWKRLDGGARLPHYIRGTSGEPLAMAGLWSSWHDPASGERIRSCAIITTRPNDLMRPIHDRMPAMVPRSDWEAWLDPGHADLAALSGLLGPAAEGMLTVYPVSTIVNDVRNNLAECVVPLSEPPRRDAGRPG